MFGVRMVEEKEREGRSWNRSRGGRKDSESLAGALLWFQRWAQLASDWSGNAVKRVGCGMGFSGGQGLCWASAGALFASPEAVICTVCAPAQGCVGRGGPRRLSWNCEAAGGLGDWHVWEGRTGLEPLICQSTASLGLVSPLS